MASQIMKVELISLNDETFDDEKVGEITLENGVLSADTKRAKRMLTEPIFVDNKFISANEDPEGFLEGLQYQYKSYALRVTAPE